MKKKLLRAALIVVGVLVVLVLGLVGYVEATAPSRLRFPDTPAPSIRASTDPAVIERGRLLVHGAAHCAACHGAIEEGHPEALREDVPLTGGNTIRPPFGVFYAANITPDRETGIGDWSDAQIARVIRTGVRRDGELSLFMKFAVGDQSDEDLVAMISYLRSLAPVRHEVPRSEPNFVGRAFVTFMALPPDPGVAMEHVPEPAEPSVERGRYLAMGMAACGGCHSPESRDEPFALDQSRLFSGGAPMEGHAPSEGEIEYVPPNLTSDPATGATGRMTEDQFVARFRSIGRTGTGSPMPWESYLRLSDVDLRSIYRYIHGLPAVHRDTGPTSRVPGTFTPPE